MFIFYQNDPCMAKMTVVHVRTVTSMLVTDVGDKSCHCEQLGLGSNYGWGAIRVTVKLRSGFN